MLNSFNDLLIQCFSERHASLVAHYLKARRPHCHHPDYGNWLGQPFLGQILPKAIVWLIDVNSRRSQTDLSHAKQKHGQHTTPVSHDERDAFLRKAPIAWAELITEWRKIL